MLQVTLNNIPVLANDSLSWRMTTGTEPVMAEFPFGLTDAQKLVDQGIVELKIVENGQVSIFKNLWALEVRSHPDPYLVNVLVADHRWLWSRKWFYKLYNLRKNYGFFRITEPNSPETQRIEEQAEYAIQTTPKLDGVPWTAWEVVSDVFDQLVEYLNAQGLAVKWRADQSFYEGLGVAFENFSSDFPFNTVIEHVLKYLPNATVTLDKNGDILLVDRTNQAEGAVDAILGKFMQGGSIARKVYSPWMTPRAINVYFTREVELKFTYTERDTAGLTSAAQILEDKGLWTQNVIPIPDYSMTISERDGSGARRPSTIFPQSTFVEFESYLDALGTAPGIQFPLTLSTMRHASPMYIDLYAALLETGRFESDGPWAARIAALQNHFRLCYRINRQWIDRILEIKPERIATVNAPFGSRAPATVISDYFYKAGQRQFYKDYAQGIPGEQLAFKLTQGSNVAGYADVVTEDTLAAPATVRIPYPDQGVFYVDFTIANFRAWEKIVPGYLHYDSVPGWGPQGQEVNIGMDVIERDDYAPYLEKDAINPSKPERQYKCSVILTAVPLAPNNTTALHKITILPDALDGISQLSAEALSNAKGAKGPPLDLRISPGIETARIRWVDGHDDTYQRLFGFERSASDQDIQKELDSFNLVLNAEENSASAASLNKLSKALAASIWGSYTPHLVGAHTGKFDSRLAPIGWTNEIVHTVHASGFITSTAVYPERLEAINWYSYLPRDIQAIISRLAIKGK